MIIGVGAGSEERDGLLLRVQSGRVVCWFEVESAVVCWMGLVVLLGVLVGVVVVMGISIVEAKRWKGGLGFGACYQKKKVINFFFRGGKVKRTKEENIDSSFFRKKPLTKEKLTIRAIKGNSIGFSFIIIIIIPESG